MSGIDIVGSDLEILGADFLGDDDLEDLLGDDDDDDDAFGASSMPFMRPAGRAQARPNRVALARRIVKQASSKQAAALAMHKLAQTGAVVRNKSYTEIRKLPAAFESSGTVAAGGSVDITVRAPVPMRPNRLFIPSSIAPYFKLTRLSVGLDNHLITSAGVPCEVFAPQATAIDESGTGFFKLPTLDVGTELNMTFENVGSSAVALSGAWICSAAC